MIDFPADPIEGQYHTDTSGNGWIFTSGRWTQARQGRILTLSQLDDVSASGATDNQVLKYDGSKFVNETHNFTYPADHKDYPATRYPFSTHIWHTHVTSSLSTGNIIRIGDVVFDPNGVIDPDAWRFNVPATGWWRINTRIGGYVGKYAIHEMTSILRVNGVQVRNVGQFSGNDYSWKTWVRLQSSSLMYLESGDYVTWHLFQKHDYGYGVYFYDQVMRVNSHTSTFTSATKRIDCDDFFNGFFVVNDTFTIEDSNNNDGTYTVASVGTHYVVVHQSLNNETATPPPIKYRRINKRRDNEFSGFLERMAT